MASYNFQARFAPAIEAGLKTQTIRARGKRQPPKPGDTLQLYTGLRTSAVRKLFRPDPVCTSVDEICISARTGVVSMIRDNRWQWLDADEIEALAREDGFDSADDFFQFFLDQHGPSLSGYLIKWSRSQPPLTERSKA